MAERLAGPGSSRKTLVILVVVVAAGLLAYSVWRQQSQPAPSTSLYYSYVASRNSDVFHYPRCSYVSQIRSYNLVGFATQAEAVGSGRRPCARCHP